MNNKKKLERILNNGYGVRSGVYSAICPGIVMKMDEYGEYQPIFTGNETEEDYKKILGVDMMSDESPNENELSKALYGGQKNNHYDSVVGHYISLYAGYVKEDDYRKIGSSGGFTTWILTELLRNNKVDYAIHARAINPSKNKGKLFEYGISKNVKKIKDGAKTRYYPMELSQVLSTIKRKPGRYAIVAIPEFITELRLLSKTDPVINERMVYFIGLVCGHQKTAKYAEALAWEQGIKPGDLESIEFRVKQENQPAINYLHRFKGKINNKSVTLIKSHDELFAESWASGFFKSKFSDFTDNTFNELADVVLGDAWLPGYDEDGKGNNIIIVRHADIERLIKKAKSEGRIMIDALDVDTIKASQSGLIHHTRDELPYRLKGQLKRGKWVPKKRENPSDKLPLLRKKVQDVRYKMATKSHTSYREAVKRDDWQYFVNSMMPHMSKYKKLYQEISGTKDKTLVVIRKKVRIRTRVRSAQDRIWRKVRIRTRIKNTKERTKALFEDRRINKYKDGAIVTLTGYFNYGNIIQRYALQEFLRQNGYRFISYAREPLDVSAPEFSRFRNTASFVQKYIIRKPFDPHDTFPAYIVGSDQVWRNWDYSNPRQDLGYYFFNFTVDTNCNRISYAASFGQDNAADSGIDSKLSRYLKPLIHKFDAISVREDSAIDIVKKAWGLKANLVADPTVLLTANDYSRLINNYKGSLSETGALFCYIITETDEKAKIVNSISNGLYKGKKIDKFYPKAMDVLEPVEQWLKGYRDADMVITDSFHGTVFSIINNTPFVVIQNEYGGSARMRSLLKVFGLEDRLVIEGQKDIVKYTNNLKPIDWRKVNRMISGLRYHSGNWLIEAIKGDKT